jgi:hypothetical protein
MESECSDSCTKAKKTSRKARGRHSTLAIREVSVTQKEAPCRRGVDHHDCEAFQGAIAETLISGYSTSPAL